MDNNYVNVCLLRNETMIIIKKDKIYSKLPKVIKSLNKTNLLKLINAIKNKINKMRNNIYDGSLIIYKNEYIGKIVKFNLNSTYCIKIEDYCFWFNGLNKIINNVLIDEIRLSNELDIINLLCFKF